MRVRRELVDEGTQKGLLRDTVREARAPGAMKVKEGTSLTNAFAMVERDGK